MAFCTLEEIQKRAVLSFKLPIPRRDEAKPICFSFCPLTISCSSLKLLKEKGEKEEISWSRTKLRRHWSLSSLFQKFLVERPHCTVEFYKGEEGSLWLNCYWDDSQGSQNCGNNHWLPWVTDAQDQQKDLYGWNSLYPSLASKCLRFWLGLLWSLLRSTATIPRTRPNVSNNLFTFVLWHSPFSLGKENVQTKYS